MDFGVGFLSNNVMLPILDFFYGIVPSYGLAIVALTLVIRFALYPLSAGSIRNMRRMKVTQPVMQKRVKEIQEQYKNDPAKQQEEMGKVYKEFGNPLAGCLPVVLQMPILFALFATLRGSPFSDVPYNINLQIVPREQIEQIQPQAYATNPQNIYVSEGVHVPVAAIVPSGNRLAVGEKTSVEFQTTSGKPLGEVLEEYPETEIIPAWSITKGNDLVRFDKNGNLEALAPGDVTLQGKVPGLASNKGFLFIKALGRVGAFDQATGAINWDILGMVLFFGVSLYVNQLLSGQASNDNSQQATVNRITPIIFSGMFLFFPLPAGVLMYMTLANVFQTLQTYILSREPLPENLQKLVDAEAKQSETRAALPFEPGKSKKEEEPKKDTKGVAAKETKATTTKETKTTTPAKASGTAKGADTTKSSGRKKKG
ncbi:membrane protein insertase YidC [Phormidium tenue FACHB-886]|nr:membrane protein insertase YidC [Phormidium tenue FACHB-886]